MTARRSPSRSLVRRLAGALLATALLAGCSTLDMEDSRHLVPIPAQLVAQMNAKGMTPHDPILIRIYKQESELEIWKRDRSGRYALLKTYPICRWSGQLGPKTASGDRQAPEGFYTVTPGLMNPNSAFHLAFNLGYPNPVEKALGYDGSALMVHGACSSAGCYAMTDEGVAEIYAVAREAFNAGQRAFQVQALPFRMTAENLARHRDSRHYAFWQNLKEGHDHFEATRQPPQLNYCGGQYVFNARPDDPDATFDPAAPCPSYTVDAQTAHLVAQIQSRDSVRKAQLAESAQIGTPMSYLDGGMHESFRRVLSRVGPDRMARMTSTNVDVSRPEAALADSYSPRRAAPRPEADRPIMTGSISRMR